MNLVKSYDIISKLTTKKRPQGPNYEKYVKKRNPYMLVISLQKNMENNVYVEKIKIVLLMDIINPLSINLKFSMLKEYFDFKKDYCIIDNSHKRKIT